MQGISSYTTLARHHVPAARAGYHVAQRLKDILPRSGEGSEFRTSMPEHILFPMILFFEIYLYLSGGTIMPIIIGVTGYANNALMSSLNSSIETYDFLKNIIM